jgi:hypothetical protein
VNIDSDSLGDTVHKHAHTIAGYTYGEATVSRSPVSLSGLELLKVSAGFTEAGKRQHRIAREVLANRTEHAPRRV